MGRPEGKAHVKTADRDASCDWDLCLNNNLGVQRLSRARAALYFCDKLLVFQSIAAYLVLNIHRGQGLLKCDQPLAVTACRLRRN